MEVDQIRGVVPPLFPHEETHTPDEQAVHPSASALTWTRCRQPFSPPTMGHALPYLDVFTVQSRRLLPLSRRELDRMRQHQQTPTPTPTKSDQTVDVLVDEPGNPSPRTGRSANGDANGGLQDGGHEGVGQDDRETSPRLEDDGVVPADVASNEYSRVSKYPSEEMLQSVRLLVEPIAIPDLTHTGVLWQHAAGAGSGARKDEPSDSFCVTQPNHTFEETHEVLFYPTGAKNSNMREYIRNTIQAHMTGLLAHNDASSSSPSHAVMNASQSVPNLASHDTIRGGGTSVSPTHTKIKKKKKHHSNSPSKLSPSKTNGVSSGARLFGSVSTSGLLNPELTRQAKDILTQLRSNTNKINDLIGSG